MKIFSLFICAAIFSTPLFYINFFPKDSLISTIYNVIGIVFAIGMGLIITFSTYGVENVCYIDKIRDEIKGIRNKFIILFFSCTLLFVLRDIAAPFILSKIVSIYTLVFFLFSISYFIINFTRLQGLKDDILDRLLKEKNDSQNTY